MNFMDIFNDDAFSLVSLTAAINNIDHVPGRAGSLVFNGVSEGIPTTTAVFESKAEGLTLIREQPRGAPPSVETKDKANVRAIQVPHFPLDTSIRADEVQGVRAFGTTDQFATVESLVTSQLRKMNQRHDLTLEYLRLGALKGVVFGPSGQIIADLFDLFGVPQHVVNFDLETYVTDGDNENDFESAIQTKVMEVARWIERNAKTVLPNGYGIHAFVGDEFFDKLIRHPSVRNTYKNTDEQRARLGDNYSFRLFAYGGVVWENYRGTDDNSTVAIAPDEAQLFLTGVPGLYAEYFAPGDFIETVNSIGLPRYAKIAPDLKYNRFVEVHTQQNPLPICLRPATLVKLTSETVTP